MNILLLWIIKEKYILLIMYFNILETRFQLCSWESGLWRLLCTREKPLQDGEETEVRN